VEIGSAENLATVYHTSKSNKKRLSRRELSVLASGVVVTVHNDKQWQLAKGKAKARDSSVGRRSRLSQGFDPTCKFLADVHVSAAN